MPEPKNAMEIFKYLDQSNCQKCGEKTCLAFAGAVFQGRKDISECPKLDPETIRKFSGESQEFKTPEQNRNDYLHQLKGQIAEINLYEAAERLGGVYKNGRLTLKVMGKDFSIDEQGTIFTDIHVNPWVAIPFLTYIIYAEGIPATGNWVPFRELKEGKERYPLFQKRCEEPMKKVADVYTELFDDVVHLFSGKKVSEQFKSDISVVLNPLPKVPLMICYWKPEDGLGSSLNIFFDETVDHNLDNGSVFSIGVGLAQMFQKFALRHGFAV